MSGKEKEMEMVEGQTLVCNKCKEVKPVGDFHTHRLSRSGYDYTCKVCKKILDKERRERKTALEEKEAVPAVAPPENTIKIDLQEYPAIFDSLKREAKNEFRTIDQQVLYVLNERYQTDRHIDDRRTDIQMTDGQTTDIQMTDSLLV